MKYNDATINRPEGTRVIDAPQFSVDLNEGIRILKGEPAWEKNDRNAITLIKTNTLTMVLVAFKAGADMLPQEINGFFTAQVLEGSVKFESVDGLKNLHANNIIALHKNEAFNLTANEDAVLLLTVMDLPA